jgi:hypothetical protein
MFRRILLTAICLAVLASAWFAATDAANAQHYGWYDPYYSGYGYVRGYDYPGAPYYPGYGPPYYPGYGPPYTPGISPHYPYRRVVPYYRAYRPVYPYETYYR